MKIEQQSLIAIEQCAGEPRCLTTYIISRNENAHSATNDYLFTILILLVYAGFNAFFNFVRKARV